MSPETFAQTLIGFAAFCGRRASDALQEPSKPVALEEGLAFVRSARMRLDFIESVLRETTKEPTP